MVSKWRKFLNLTYFCLFLNLTFKDHLMSFKRLMSRQILLILRLCCCRGLNTSTSFVITLHVVFCLCSITTAKLFGIFCYFELFEWHRINNLETIKLKVTCTFCTGAEWTNGKQTRRFCWRVAVLSKLSLRQAIVIVRWHIGVTIHIVCSL